MSTCATVTRKSYDSCRIVVRLSGGSCTTFDGESYDYQLVVAQLSATACTTPKNG
ncbi:MAG: hypothetical protein LBN24_09105 [Mediterranea sp.]|nr:hypothetical protein [Mediterranea sp.]